MWAEAVNKKIRASLITFFTAAVQYFLRFAGIRTNVPTSCIRVRMVTRLLVTRIVSCVCGGIKTLRLRYIFFLIYLFLYIQIVTLE